MKMLSMNGRNRQNSTIPTRVVLETENPNFESIKTVLTSTDDMDEKKEVSSLILTPHGTKQSLP